MTDGTEHTIQGVVSKVKIKELDPEQEFKVVTKDINDEKVTVDYVGPYPKK